MSAPYIETKHNRDAQGKYAPKSHTDAGPDALAADLDPSFDVPMPEPTFSGTDMVMANGHVIKLGYVSSSPPTEHQFTVHKDGAVTVAYLSNAGITDQMAVKSVNADGQVIFAKSRPLEYSRVPIAEQIAAYRDATAAQYEAEEQTPTLF